MVQLTETQEQILGAVRRFVEKDVLPVASELEHRDEYPAALVRTMREMGLFGATIPAEHGGMGLDVLTYALIVEELSRGWMSLSGVLNTHLMVAYHLRAFGTPAQRERWLPRMATGELHGGLGLSEPHAGSDVQAIRTAAVRRGDRYVVNGTKMFITNGRRGNIFSLAVKTDPKAQPPYKGISLLLVEKGHPGFQVGRDLKKLGYKGIETCELIFEDVEVPAANLIGGVEGEGFGQVLSGLEVGRINVAARGVGVARAAFEEAIRYAQRREAFGVPIARHQAIQLKLADMATRVTAARLLVSYGVGP